MEAGAPFNVDTAGCCPSQLFRDQDASTRAIREDSLLSSTANSPTPLIVLASFTKCPNSARHARYSPIWLCKGSYSTPSAIPYVRMTSSAGGPPFHGPADQSITTLSTFLCLSARRRTSAPTQATLAEGSNEYNNDPQQNNNPKRQVTTISLSLPQTRTYRATAPHPHSWVGHPVRPRTGVKTRTQCTITHRNKSQNTRGECLSLPRSMICRQAALTPHSSSCLDLALVQATTALGNLFQLGVETSFKFFHTPQKQKQNTGSECSSLPWCIICRLVVLTPHPWVSCLDLALGQTTTGLGVIAVPASSITHTNKNKTQEASARPFSGA